MLSYQFHSEFDELILSFEPVPELLGGGAALSRGLGDDSLCADTDVGEQVTQGEWRFKERLEPAVSESLQIADEFEKTQLALLAGPQGSSQGGTQRLGQHDQQQSSVEITQRGFLGFGGNGRQMEITFPRLEH